MAAPAKTNAVRLIEAAGVPHELAAYDLEGAEFSAGAVAAALGLPPDRIYKTLAVRAGPDTVLAVVPGDAELDLKATAAAAGVKKVRMAEVAALERLTGYRRGSVTAIGTRRPLPVLLDASALEHDRIAVSAGAEGLQLLIAPADYVEVTEATVVRIATGRLKTED